MEEERIDQQMPEQIPGEQEVYTPRPRWQIWLARIGLGLFLLFLAAYYYNMFTRGGV